MIHSIQDAERGDVQIPGVRFKLLKSFPDDRGFFREVIRANDDFFEGAAAGPRCFAQWSHSKMSQNTVKAWHFHHRQIDWWYLPIGLAHVVLFDAREESPARGRKIEFMLGDADEDSRVLTVAVRIPQGVLHGLKVLSDFAHLFYVTSETYNPQDEGRYPFNDAIVPHSWGKEDSLIVAPNDRKLHIPPHPRTALVA